MSPSDQPNFENIKHSVARGAAWMVGMRWTIRSIGLINTIILARLLTPQDFGLVAMVTVVLGFLDSIADPNVEIPLLRKRHIGRCDYDSAWTLQAIAGAVKSLLFIIIAPLLVRYYGDPRVGTIACIIALRPVIEGFENIGQLDFRRDLRFDKDFRYWVYRRLLTFVLTIGFVLWFRNYLALAIAAPISAAVTVFLSFMMSGYRPRFATSHIGEIWRFSKWWMLGDAMRFFGHRGEAFILGNLTTPHVIGAYSVGADLSVRMTEDVVGPIGRALIPNYAIAQDQPDQLLRVFQLSIALLASFSLVTGVGVSLVAKDLVLVLLGTQWLSAIPFVQWLALHGACWSMVQSMQPYFLITKREKLFILCITIYALVLVPAIIIAAHVADVETVAITRTAVTAFFSLGMFGVLVALKVFNPGNLASLLWRPVVATIAMAMCMVSIDLAAPPIIALGLRAAAGIVTFSFVLVFLWGIAGWPNGPEMSVFTLFSDYSRAARDRLKSVWPW